MKKTLIVILVLTTSLLVISKTQAAVSDLSEKNATVIWQSPNKENGIALTFDDGPDPRITPQILNVLNTYNAKATFFVTGKKAQKNPKLIQIEINGGHEVANHTYSHPNFRRLSSKRIRSEILKCEKVIQYITSQRPKLFRTPGDTLIKESLRLQKKMDIVLFYGLLIKIHGIGQNRESKILCIE